VIRTATLNVIGGAAAALDRAATLAAYAQTVRMRRRNRAESLGHDARLQALALLAAQYSESLAERYFRAPRAIDPSLRVVRSGPGSASVVDVTWQSEYRVFLEEADVRARFARHRENQLGAARLFNWGSGRPVAILIHGYMGGHHRFEQRVWPVEWLGKLGLDVALFVLPFHGMRADPTRRRPPPFPGSDPRMTNEGFRQTVADLGDFAHWLRARGHAAVGIMGMSLGGYTTALFATVDPKLAFAVPIIPLASLADFARDQRRLGSTPEQTALQHQALDRVYRLISPLYRAPAIPSERVLVIGAKADRITPLAHAQRIARHFGAPLETWLGGHLLQIGRSDGFRHIGRLLSNLGLTEPRR
jgi:dienelactone hydrolase